MTDVRYTVYWQPGCTSCLKAREFLATHAIDFESINVRATPGAEERLRALGARSIPVIARGQDWTYAQDLDDVARFLGIVVDRVRLPAATLIRRVCALLTAAARYTAQLPESVLETPLPGRTDRAGADLAFHVPMIVQGFLVAAKGGQLSFDVFERRPAGTARAVPELVTLQRETSQALERWWRDVAYAPPAAVDTYYGRQTLDSVLERTAWHVAQHTRQLESLAAGGGRLPEGALTDAELGGLPLPEGLWDPEFKGY